MPPPLDRVQIYVEMLDALRARSRSLPAGDLLAAFDNLAPALVREDLRTMGIGAGEHDDVNLQDTFWKVYGLRDLLEQEALSAVDVKVQLPSEEEIVRALRGVGGMVRAAIPADQAVRLTDDAFDASLESKDLFVLGQGRMRAGEVAFRHQLVTAKRVLEEMHGVAIVADEVGLGKTIVAGLIVEELLAREPQATVLILVPPNLREQWAESELPKFFGRSIPWDLGKETTAVAARNQVVLLSIDRAKGKLKGRQDALTATLLQRRWDLLILDEAHDCRNQDRLRFRFVYSLRARRRIFLTATPIHNSGYDIFTLATLLKPGCLGPRSNFSENYMAGERAIANGEALQRALAPLMTRTLRRDSGLSFARRQLTAIEVADFKEEESALYDELLAVLRGIYHRHMGPSAKLMTPARPLHVSQFVLIAMLVLREMASHPLAAIETLRKALRQRVAEFARMTRDDSDLAKLDAFIERYTNHPWDVSHHAKSQRLITEAGRLISAGRKLIIYVNYLKTLNMVVEALRKEHPEIRVLSYEGKMSPGEKKNVIRLLGDPAVRACLVSTDAGGQGLNLQAADCVVNYDFPWNPMRVEQRVGRVDRASQESKEISILNFKTVGTVEEYVQIVLTWKLNECISVLGEFSSPFEIEKIYEDKLTMGIGTALMESTDADDMRRRMQRLAADDLRRYVGDYAQYEKDVPSEWTWRPQD